MTTTFTTVQLSRLRFGHEFPGNSLNSRVVGRDAEIEQLARSIQEEDLLLPLIVAKSSETGTEGEVYYVIDGNRRLAALRTMVKDRPVEVKVVSNVSEAGALRLSYAANGHVPLHPADRAEFFAKQSKELSADQIAEKFGMTLRTVQQSIALGGTLAPEILNLWRTGEMPRAFIEIFTLAASQEVQLTTLEWLKTQWKWQDGREQTLTELRRKLTKGKEPEMKRLLGFVGIDGFRAAGGVVTEDFFGTGGVVQDMKLLHKLAKTKMDELLDRAKSDGWAWAEGRMRRSNMDHGYGQMKAKAEYTPTETKQLAEIDAKLKKLDKESTKADLDDTDLDRIDAERERLEAERGTIEAAAELRSYTAKQKAKGGVIVSICEDGSLHYDVGLLRRDGEEKKAKPKQGGAADYQQRQDPIDYKARNALSDWQDTAAGELLAEYPHEAFAAFLAALTVDRHNGDSPINSNRMHGVSGLTNAKGFLAAFDDLNGKSASELALLMGKVAANCADLSDYQGRIKKSAKPILDLIGEKAYQDLVAKKFDPKVYFGGASKQHILGCIREALGEDARKAAESKNEDALRKDAITTIGKTGWLPPELRTGHYVKPTPPKMTVAKLEPKPKKTAVAKKATTKRKAA